jgi:hypothetical protein
VKKGRGKVLLAEFENLVRTGARVGAGLVLVGRKLGSFRRRRGPRRRNRRHGIHSMPKGLGWQTAPGWLKAKRWVSST